MKKFISAFDGLKFSNATMKYSIDLALHSNAILTGVFLDDMTYHGYKFAEVIAESGGVSDTLIRKLNNKDEEIREQAVENFKAACQLAHVKYVVHRDKNVAIQELLHESIFGDLLIIDNKESFSSYERKMPASFMQELLSDIQCPVMVVPENYSKVEKVVLLYDGEPSSVYAFKIFSYLFPSLKTRQTEILTVNSEEDKLILPDKRLLMEFTNIHYPSADYIILKGDTEPQIVQYLKQQKDNLLVILGAYRRSRVSRWLRHSLADVLMNQLQIPLFIAHNK